MSRDRCRHFGSMQDAWQAPVPRGFQKRWQACDRAGLKGFRCCRMFRTLNAWKGCSERQISVIMSAKFGIRYARVFFSRRGYTFLPQKASFLRFQFAYFLKDVLEKSFAFGYRYSQSASQAVSQASQSDSQSVQVSQLFVGQSVRSAGSQ